MTKTWQEKINKDAYFDEKIGEMVLETKNIVKIISDLRKKDEEELINIFDIEGSEIAPERVQLLIKDYYNK